VIFCQLPVSGKHTVDVELKDYECLQENKWLNDTIIDFSLQNVEMPRRDRKRTYIFSTQFYTSLTSQITESEVNIGQTQSQIRFERVKNWTKNTNLFEKDFIVVPIHDINHWFVAIICYPNHNSKK
jgi:Ulp1 family protease